MNETDQAMAIYRKGGFWPMPGGRRWREVTLADLTLLHHLDGDKPGMAEIETAMRQSRTPKGAQPSPPEAKPAKKPSKQTA